jgi:CubicO group peptidase (beta-lactamase class C family)
MHRFARALFAALLFAFCLHAAAQETAPVWPDAQWQHATPEALGMDSRALATLVEYGANVQMDSLIVTRHGKVVAEAYYAPFKAGMKHRINSATKGVVAALAGIAVGQGVLAGTDTPVLQLLADRTAANVDDRKRAMTLQSLLDMTSGMAWTEPLSAASLPESMIAMQRSADWQQFIIDQQMVLPPGRAFNYNSGNSHLVSAIIARKTGMSTQDFAAQQLFKPLGITDFLWRKDPQGISIGGFGLYLQTPDMAKIGYLYLHRGAWNGAQIVPSAWVDKVFGATTVMTPMAGWRYADFWWTLPGRKAYMALGYKRQVIMVLPDIGVVAAMTGRGFYPIENVIDQIKRAVKSDQALAADPDAHASLRDKIEEYATEKATAAPMATPALAQAISGKAYRLANNAWGWTELTLHLGEAPSYEVVSHSARGAGSIRKASRPLGMDGRFAIFDSGKEVVASKATWTDDRTLTLIVRLPQEASTLTFELRFEGDSVRLVHTNEFGQKRTVTGELQSAAHEE